MKNFLVLLLIVTFYSEGSAQSAKVTLPKGGKLILKYDLEFKSDSNSAETRHREFVLLTDGTESLFEELSALHKDSLTHVYENLPINENNVSIFTKQMTQIPRPVFSFVIYKHYSSKELIFLDKIGKVNYFYTEPAEIIVWSVTQEEKNVAGYSCKKATTIFGGRTWNAWFTEEIPISDGPYKFYGLPGLIVQANDSKSEYVFLLKNINQSFSNISVTPPKEKLTKTTKKELVQAKKDYQLSIPTRMASNGAAAPESVVQAYMQRIKKQNNPLEIR